MKRSSWYESEPRDPPPPSVLERSVSFLRWYQRSIGEAAMRAFEVTSAVEHTLDPIKASQALGVVLDELERLQKLEKEP